MIDANIPFPQGEYKMCCSRIKIDMSQDHRDFKDKPVFKGLSFGRTPWFQPRLHLSFPDLLLWEVWEPMVRKNPLETQGLELVISITWQLKSLEMFFHLPLDCVKSINQLGEN